MDNVQKLKKTLKLDKSILYSIYSNALKSIIAFSGFICYLCLAGKPFELNISNFALTIQITTNFTLRSKPIT